MIKKVGRDAMDSDFVLLFVVLFFNYLWCLFYYSPPDAPFRSCTAPRAPPNGFRGECMCMGLFELYEHRLRTFLAGASSLCMYALDVSHMSSIVTAWSI